MLLSWPAKSSNKYNIITFMNSRLGLFQRNCDWKFGSIWTHLITYSFYAFPVRNIKSNRFNVAELIPNNMNVFFCHLHGSHGVVIWFLTQHSNPVYSQSLIFDFPEYVSILCVDIIRNSHFYRCIHTVNKYSCSIQIHWMNWKHVKPMLCVVFV